jgi:hydrogenase maturation protease
MIDAETVVLGVGSPLMGDDGLGVEVVNALGERWAASPELQFLDGGVWGMLLFPYIESASKLLIVDVIRNGRVPGTLIRLERDEIPRHLRTKLSPHQIDLSEVLALAELRGTFPPEAVALGIEPAEVELQEGLSPVVRASVPELMAAVERQLLVWGHALQPREAGARA